MAITNVTRDHSAHQQTSGLETHWRCRSSSSCHHKTYSYIDLTVRLNFFFLKHSCKIKARCSPASSSRHFWVTRTSKKPPQNDLKNGFLSKAASPPKWTYCNRRELDNSPIHVWDRGSGSTLCLCTNGTCGNDSGGDGSAAGITENAPFCCNIAPYLNITGAWTARRPPRSLDDATEKPD